MSVCAYETKPVKAEAIEWTGSNLKDVAALVVEYGYGLSWERRDNGVFAALSVCSDNEDEDWRDVNEGDWIVAEEGVVKVFEAQYFNDNYRQAGATK